MASRQDKIPHMWSQPLRVSAFLTSFAISLGSSLTAQTYEPTVGQAGQGRGLGADAAGDRRKMLDLAGVTPDDFVMDLGFCDGRTMIPAARRGARARASNRTWIWSSCSPVWPPRRACPTRRRFVQGDMYEADTPKANVLALFLLRNISSRRTSFLASSPGRASSPTPHHSGSGLGADEQATIEDDCSAWRTALLRIVPAKVAGRWQFEDGELALTQKYQMVSGELTAERQDGAGRTGSDEGPGHHLHRRRPELRRRGERQPDRRDRDPCRWRREPFLDCDQNPVGLRPSEPSRRCENPRRLAPRVPYAPLGGRRSDSGPPTPRTDRRGVT